MPNLKLTLKAWPVIAGATIGLCFLTQTVAKLFGIELPDQENIEIVRQCFTHALDSARHFSVAALHVVQVILVMPVLEELLFRGLIFKFPCKNRPDNLTFVRVWAVVSAALFSAAHYIKQPWPDSAFLALFFFGLAQCWLYRKTNRIWCAMLNHALFNLTNLILLFVIPQS